MSANAKAQREYIAALEVKNANLEAECQQLREQLRTLALGPQDTPDDMSVMKNYQVASCFITNALAYLESGDWKTVKTNLQLIEQLLEQPNAVNTEYEWEDFK
jgi:hypothetical protein